MIPGFGFYFNRSVISLLISAQVPESILGHDGDQAAEQERLRIDACGGGETDAVRRRPECVRWNLVGSPLAAHATNELLHINHKQVKLHFPTRRGAGRLDSECGLV